MTRLRDTPEYLTGLLSDLAPVRAELQTALFACAVAAAVTVAATALLAALYRRADLGDGAERAADEAERRRKLQARPVPPVGGPALLLGIGAGVAVGGATWAGTGGGALLASALLAFVVGFLDDSLRGGLGARVKLAGQALAGLPLALAAGAAAGGDPVAALLVLLLAVVAQNAINTFDNADGAAATLSAVALALPFPVAAAALAGFLPLNLDGRRDAGEERSGPRAAPSAYLGDSGTHLLGILILACPPAWPVLCLPLLDLARVAVLRVRAGVRPWIGDRRHLAHRLQVRGLSTFGVLAILIAVAAPTAVSGERVGLGLAATSVLFALAVLATRVPGAQKVSITTPS